MPSANASLANDVREYYSLNERFYAKFAPFYDLVVAPFRSIRRQVVRLTSAPPSSRVLDVATGTGEQAFAFAAAGHAVVGVDISEAMLARARRKARKGNPQFLHGDATHLPLPAKAFDVACVCFALHEMPPSVRGQILEEMVRVTKPSGRVVVVDYGLPQNAVARAIVFRAVKLYESKPYAEFVRSNVCTELERAGVVIIQDWSSLFGAARIIVGRPGT